MTRKKVGSFTVEYVQILDEKGKCDEKLNPKISGDELKKMYELMVLTRAFDQKALTLQRQGRIGTFASVKGQEACQIPSAIQMKAEDLAFPAFREHGVFITRQMPLVKLLQYWGGDERGMAIPDDVNMFPVAITVGAHTLHAVGRAMGMQMQKKDGVSLVYFGDGATSEGDFHEAMNFAGRFNAPCIFMCQNNQWAISTPVKEQTASETLAQKAIAYGFEGVQVDGNDVLAVYKVVQDALAKARKGKGPTFIECFTYRLGDHTTSDDAKRYRPEEEVKKWEVRDPLVRFKTYLLKKKVINEADDKKLWENAEAEVNAAVEAYEKITPMKAEEMFTYMYDELPQELKEQQESLKG